MVKNKNVPDLPPEMFTAQDSPLAEVGLPVRFSDETMDLVEALARKYGLSRAKIIRMLVESTVRRL